MASAGARAYTDVWSFNDLVFVIHALNFKEFWVLNIAQKGFY